MQEWNTERWTSVSQVAKELAVTRQTVRNWIDKGQILSYQAVPGGPYRVPVFSVEAMKRRSPRI